MRSVLLRGGQRLNNVHPAKGCHNPCPIHNVTDHPYRQWDQWFTGSIMWRIDPETKRPRLDPDQGNAIECDRCENVIASRYRHHYVTCPCGHTSIDGGFDYRRVVIREDVDATE